MSGAFTELLPIRWSAPEVLENGPSASTVQSDVWSFGVGTTILQLTVNVCSALGNIFWREAALL
jgi:hypothetical protein